MVWLGLASVLGASVPLCPQPSPCVPGARLGFTPHSALGPTCQQIPWPDLPADRLQFVRSNLVMWITVAILELIHAAKVAIIQITVLILDLIHATNAPNPPPEELACPALVSSCSGMHSYRSCAVLSRCSGGHLIRPTLFGFGHKDVGPCRPEELSMLACAANFKNGCPHSPASLFPSHSTGHTTPRPVGPLSPKCTQLCYTDLGFTNFLG